MPLPLHVNCFYKRLRLESDERTVSFNSFTDKKRELYFVPDFKLFAAYTYPDATYDQVGVFADLLNPLSTIDMVRDDLNGFCFSKGRRPSRRS